MSYTNVFGGYNINTAFPSYMNYVISGNLQLNWASSFVDTVVGTNNVTAHINDLAGTSPFIIINNNPISTTEGSGVVIVTIPSNPNLITGNFVTIAGATTTNGITDVQLNITAQITVINSTSFSYVTAGTAGGGPFTGGGNAVTYDPLPLVTLADATLISVGQTIQFNNVGTNLITIQDFLGNQIVQIPPTALSNQYILYLQDNTTQGGTWGITQLGAGTSQANANALAGYGTISLNSQINTNFPGKTIGANYIVQLSDRASILIWTGGAGTITLPNQISGFYIAVNNEGSGVVTINTPDATTIDGQASIGINPGGSSYFIGVATNWNTLGNGIETFFNVQSITIPLTNANVNLTAQQSAAIVQQYSGNITANIIVFYPAVAGQSYVWNNTNGGFTVSAQLSGPTGMAIIIPQGEKVILYSDGNSIYNTPTIATNATFPDGNSGAPGINFAAQNTTGFYRIDSGLTGYASAGTEGLTFGGPGPGYGLGISGGLSERYYNATNTNYVGFQAGALSTNQVWTLPLVDSAGTQALTSNGAGILSWQPFGTGSVTNVSGTVNRITVANPTTTPVIDISGAYVGQTSITTLGDITSGTWSATPVTIPFGGTGLATLTTAYGVVCAGTTPTGALQNAGAGTAGQFLMSNGGGDLPSFQTLPAASKSNQIAAASSTVFITPSVQQFHPSATKFWCTFTTSAGGAVVTSSYNVATVVRNSLGKYTITYTVPFTTANYNIGVSIGLAGTNYSSGLVETQATGSCQVSVFYIAGTPAQPIYADGNTVFVQGYGTQ